MVAEVLSKLLKVWAKGFAVSADQSNVNQTL
jgi:hypothetical protein